MNYLFILIMAFIFPLTASAESLTPQSKELLDILDRVIERKDEFHQQRNEQIERLKGQAKRANGLNRIALYKEIYSLYSHYQTDSALVYIQRLAQIPEVKQDSVNQAYLHIAQADVWSVMGLYSEAIQELELVPHTLISDENQELQRFYYRTQRTLYGWMTDYAELHSPRRLWAEKTQAYRDSLIAIEPAGMGRDIVIADKAIAGGNPQAAIDLLLPYTKDMDIHNPNPYVCFTLAQAYEALKQEKRSTYYLILTSIADIRYGTTEYQALPFLAQYLSDIGQVERAYNYLLCSMEDAAICKARLRAVEVSNIFPIIDKQYKQIEQDKGQFHLLFIALLMLFLVIVSGSLVYTYKQVMKLRQLRRKQAETNKQLSEANEKIQAAMEELRAANEQLASTNRQLHETFGELQLTDKMKEEYIARYLDRCRGYIDTLVEFRRNALRLMKEHKQDELIKQLKSESSIKDEQEKFYADFDEAFLTLFPDFIDNFNALLPEEHRIVPKHENQLNTELRIFALIRLGVNDTNRIAHFLNFSLATVYNYRSKMRNRALCDSTEFEALVEGL